MVSVEKWIVPLEMMERKVYQNHGLPQLSFRHRVMPYPERWAMLSQPPLVLTHRAASHPPPTKGGQLPADSARRACQRRLESSRQLAYPEEGGRSGLARCVAAGASHIITRRHDCDFINLITSPGRNAYELLRRTVA